MSLQQTLNLTRSHKGKARTYAIASPSSSAVARAAQFTSLFNDGDSTPVSLLGDDIATLEDACPREPPHLDANPGLRFTIQWEKLFYRNRRVYGLGYRVRHKRSIRKNIPPSWIWQYGADLEQQTKEARIQFFLCRSCHTKNPVGGLFIVNGTEHIMRHLRHHGVDKDGLIQQAIVPSTPFQAATAYSSTVAPLHTPFDTTRYTAKLTDWAITQDLTFRQVCHEETQEMLAYDRPQLKAALPRSHTTLSEWVKQAYADRHIELKEKLLLAKSKLHISCDIWSSLNGFSLLGVVAHFLDENHKQQTALLGLPRLRGSHSGVNIAETLATIIQKYDISYKLGYFQMDNASNNNTCIDHLATLLPLPMKARLRCMGHIINLVVQAILFGKGINTFKRELLGCSDKDHFTLWKQLHAIGKIHNTVRDILRSEARRRDFAECQQEVAFEDELFDWVELMLVVDGGVRWNATYYMLRRARKLREAIDIYQKRHIDAPLNAEEYDHTADVLTEEDWTEVDRFLKLLKPFEVITKDLEGNARQGSYGAVWEAFTSMNYLSDILIKEEATVKPEVASGYEDGVIMGLQKINEYWDVMRENPVYASAVILNPMLKHEWLVDHWRKFPKWASAVKASMESLFKDY
ncbi:hypothetical protein B0A49_13143, partial [Cryomyces minteri]